LPYKADVQNVSKVACGVELAACLFFLALLRLSAIPLLKSPMASTSTARNLGISKKMEIK